MEKKNFLKQYKNYYEISNVLQEYNFFRAQGSVYLRENSDLANLMEAIQALADIEWFANSVRDIRAFKIEDWSNFTRIVKKKATNN